MTTRTIAVPLAALPTQPGANALAAYLNTVAHRGRSTATIRQYTFVLSRFLRHAAEQGAAWPNLTADTCRTFVNEPGVAQSTAALRSYVLSRFVRWARTTGHLPEDALNGREDALIRPWPQSRREPLTVDEARRVAAQLRGSAVQVAFWLLLSGVRLAEISRLTVGAARKLNLPEPARVRVLAALRGRPAGQWLLPLPTDPSRPAGWHTTGRPLRAAFQAAGVPGVASRRLLHTAAAIADDPDPFLHQITEEN